MPYWLQRSRESFACRSRMHEIQMMHLSARPKKRITRKKMGKAFSHRRETMRRRFDTCRFETRHRNNPGMARGRPSHDAKETRPRLSASLLAAPLGTDDDRKKPSALSALAAALAYDLNSIDTAGCRVKRKRSKGGGNRQPWTPPERSPRPKFVGRVDRRMWSFPDDLRRKVKRKVLPSSSSNSTGFWIFHELRSRGFRSFVPPRGDTRIVRSMREIR